MLSSRTFYETKTLLKGEQTMKTIMISFLIGITMMLGTSVMAGSAPTLPAPTGLSCTPDADSVFFDWDDLLGAEKYSVDVEVLIDGIWNEGIIVKFSFGTSARTDGYSMTQSDLDVLLTEFTYDIDGDTYPDQLSGFEARAKVKGLTRGRSQNNPFTDWVYFTLP
ncbi:MAG TPA: hypothetical protein DDX93_03630 [Smithella sp.]|nr:hypothetical protein [Smithella sp.]